MNRHFSYTSYRPPPEAVLNYLSHCEVLRSQPTRNMTIQMMAKIISNSNECSKENVEEEGTNNLEAGGYFD